MKTSFAVMTSRLLAVLCLFGLLTAFSQRASADAVAPTPMVGPWLVAEATDKANVGLRMYFSPDGGFFLVDPNSQAGVPGTYSVGRAGLVINTFGYGKAAEFMAGDVAVKGDVMTIDVKRSGVMQPQRVVLKRIVVKTGP